MKHTPLDPLILWKTCERPPEWERRFGRHAPLELEIGYGGGDWLVRCAREHPERNFVGIETQWPCTKRALRKIRTAGLENVRLLQMDARVALQRMFRERSLAAITSLFPCPWPKERHARHRLFTTAFLKLAASRLEDGGRLLVVTDAEPLAAWIETQAPGSGLAFSRRLVAPRFETKYERKWRGLGQSEFFEISLTKEEHPPLPLLEDQPLQAHRLERFDPETFRPRDLSEEDLHVAFKDFLYDPRRRRGMLLAVVVEDPLEQTFWVEIAEHEGGWRVRPARGSGVVPTPGVQRALDRVRDEATRSG